MVLGARPQQIRASLPLGLRLLARGTILRVIGAWLARRAMQAILFRVSALNLAALAGLSA